MIRIIMVFISLLKLTVKNVKVIQILMTAIPIIIKFNKLKKSREKLNPFLVFPEISILVIFILALLSSIYALAEI